MQTFDEDAVKACADLGSRVGARQFEIGYLNDEDDPAFATDGPRWYAHVSMKGTRITEDDHPGPVEAADALARRLLTGGRCKCGRLVALSDEGAVAFRSSRLVHTNEEWTAEEAEKAGQCRWTRMGPRWESSCDAPSLTRDSIVDGKFQFPQTRKQRRAKPKKKGKR